MARILLSAYACEPDRGSEPGVGWSWVSELSRLGHRLWVLTRADNRAAIEGRAPSGVKFIYYDLPRPMLRVRTFPGGKRLYYVLWQWFAVQHIRKHFSQLPFDMVQHVTYVSARYPSFMGLLGVPFYFGPVSGGESVPVKLREGFPRRERWREWLRDLSNRLVPFDPLLRLVFRQATRIIVTPATVALVPPRWREKCSVQLAVGLSKEYLRQARAVSRHTGPGPGHSWRLLYVGRLLECKGVDIALRAVWQLKQWLDVRFTIVGDGPARAQLEKLVEGLGLTEVVEWVGWLPHHEVEDHYRAAELFLFLSLRDSGGVAVLEALAHGLPVVCTELGGPGVIVNEHCGRVLQARDKNTEELATDCAHALREILTTPGLWDRLSAGAKSRAQDFDSQNLVASIYPVSSFPAAADQHEHSLPLSALVARDAAL